MGIWEVRKSRKMGGNERERGERKKRKEKSNN